MRTTSQTHTHHAVSPTTTNKTDSKHDNLDRANTKTPIPETAGVIDPLGEVSESTNLISPEVVKHLAQVETLIKQCRDMDAGALTEPIHAYAMQAAIFSRKAVQAGASALVFAWACGKLLNAVKKEFDRGTFGDWREEFLLSENMSERTSQRYMRLARQCQDVKSLKLLLKWSPSLRQAYIACGVLPDQEKLEKASGTPPPKSCALLASISGLQKSLRLFAVANEKLNKADLNQLTLMRDELNRFFDQVIPLEK